MSELPGSEIEEAYPLGTKVSFLEYAYAAEKRYEFWRVGHVVGYDLPNKLLVRPRYRTLDELEDRVEHVPVEPAFWPDHGWLPQIVDEDSQPLSGKPRALPPFPLKLLEDNE